MSNEIQNLYLHITHTTFEVARPNYKDIYLKQKVRALYFNLMVENKNELQNFIILTLELGISKGIMLLF